jgi:digeranylgeranylglycerophospholipid reductase
VNLYVAGSKDHLPAGTFDKLRSESPLSPFLESAAVIKKTGCSVNVMSPMQVPHRANVMVIGDAAAFVEVEVQGALMCGFHAGNAVSKELEGGNGFAEYTAWWQKAFEFNSDEALRVAQGYALVPTYTDDELDYLFSLTEGEVLEGSYSQYKSPKLMWDAFLKHRDRIKRERPELNEKIEKNSQLTLHDA